MSTGAESDGHAPGVAVDANPRARSATRGELAVVLHTHMPYVEGYGTWPFGEEWLWEAVACVYLPLLARLQGARFTLTLTPVLCDQLEALRGPARERFVSFLHETRARLHEEDAQAFERAGASELAAEARRAAGDYEWANREFVRRRGDLLAAFATLAPEAELWTSAATHAVLPLLATPAGVELQVLNGIESHRRRFGSWSGGFWLPECAYTEGLERALADGEVKAFCVDQTTALGLGSLAQLEPIDTGLGPLAVPIDWQTARLVWDGPHGHPGAAVHRSYEKATDNALKLWCNDGRPYDREASRATAHRQAREFLASVAARLDDYRHARGRRGLVCFAADTEIFGHWWYEGIDWLSAVLQDAPAWGIELVTLPSALAARRPAAAWTSPAAAGTHTATPTATGTAASAHATTPAATDTHTTTFWHARPPIARRVVVGYAQGPLDVGLTADCGHRGYGARGGVGSAGCSAPGRWTDTHSTGARTRDSRVAGTADERLGVHEDAWTRGRLSGCARRGPRGGTAAGPRGAAR